MAHACLACPRNSNIPDDYDTLPDEEKAFYVHAWAIDGNFKAEHTTSRRPRNNVQIFPGTGFFPDPDDFAEKTKKPFTDKSLPTSMVCGHSEGICRVVCAHITIRRRATKIFATSIPPREPSLPRLIHRRISAASCLYAALDMVRCFPARPLMSGMQRSILSTPLKYTTFAESDVARPKATMP